LRLQQPFYENTVAVLLASCRKDLLDILSLQDLLLYMRIILILPNREHDTVAMGHTLRPRFISYCDSDFLEVSGVLCRMMSALDARKNVPTNTDKASHNAEFMGNKRKFKRYDIEVPARIEVTASRRGKEVFDLQTANVSAKGALFRTMESLPEGTKFKADIFIPLDEVKDSSDSGNTLIIKVTGQVLRSGPSGMAVCFNDDYRIMTRNELVKQEGPDYPNDGIVSYNHNDNR